MRHYKKIIIAALIITVFLGLGYGVTELLSQSSMGMGIPKDLPAFVLQERVASKFGGEETIFIAVCLDEETTAEDIPRDIRDPKVVESVVELHKRLENETSIERVQSIAPPFKEVVPDDLERVGKVLSGNFTSSQLEGFINRDFSIMLIKVSPIAGLSGEEVEKVTELIQDDVDSITKPAGVKYRITSIDPQTHEMIEDQFPGSLRKLTIVVETKPRYANSEEIRDIRDPEVLRYVDLLAERAKLVHGVVSAESAADVIKEANDGQIPNSLRSVMALLERLEKDEITEQRISNYISEDRSMTLVRLNILEDVDAEEIVEELKEVINIESPPGISVDITGGPVIEVTMKELA
jgi:predicted RND superfamily exporter protein